MADAAPKSEGRKGARKHTGLGRGLGALIPQASEQTPQNAPSAPSRPLDVFSPKAAPLASVEVLQRNFCSPSVAQPRRRRSVRRCRPLRQPVAGAVPALAAPLAVESMAQIPARRRLVCPQQALPRTKQRSMTNRMFHVKHPSITSFFRFPVHPSPKLRSIRSFPTPRSLVRSSMRMI